MNKRLYHLYCRVFQTTLFLVSPLLPYKKQRLITGARSILTLPAIIKESHKQHICIISDTHVITLPIVQELLIELQKENIHYSIFDEVPPNPTVASIEKAKIFYSEQKCDSLVAIGGGSSIDSAKALGALIAYPKKSLYQMKGILKVHRAIPFLIAIPSTAGTGSEATVAAVVTDPSLKEKYAINSFPLIPKVAILDSELTRTLPLHLTSTTAMDALTHAIEAYIGNSSTLYSRKASIDATTIIFNEIEKVHKDVNLDSSRQKLLIASYRGGEAFTRSYVGNVHALSHPLTAYYGIAHGLANAVTLPHVLIFYGTKAHKKLASLAREAHIIEKGKSDEETATLFIEKIRALNKALDIKEGFKEIREEDLGALIHHALGEANPLYPVPVIFDEDDCRTIYHNLMK
ncbi:MAG: iron-containing alcohol dehydrogenase [Spirochaetia bacterium]|nr:iron-containing alcohol dehydrogenase [Spirochaetia bacterium]